MGGRRGGGVSFFFGGGEGLVFFWGVRVWGVSKVRVVFFKKRRRGGFGGAMRGKDLQGGCKGVCGGLGEGRGGGGRDCSGEREVQRRGGREEFSGFNGVQGVGFVGFVGFFGGFQGLRVHVVVDENLKCQHGSLRGHFGSRPPLLLRGGSVVLCSFSLASSFSRLMGRRGWHHRVGSMLSVSPPSFRWPNARQTDGVRPSAAGVQGRWRLEHSKVSPEVVMENGRKQVSGLEAAIAAMIASGVDESAMLRGLASGQPFRPDVLRAAFTQHLGG